nr:MAG TPA: hypothetical protein [Bacteriophage sp.]
MILLLFPVVCYEKHCPGGFWVVSPFSVVLWFPPFWLSLPLFVDSLCSLWLAFCCGFFSLSVIIVYHALGIIAIGIIPKLRYAIFLFLVQYT